MAVGWRPLLWLASSHLKLHPTVQEADDYIKCRHLANKKNKKNSAFESKLEGFRGHRKLKRKTVISGVIQLRPN